MPTMQAPSPQNGSLQIKNTNLIPESLLKAFALNISVAKNTNSNLNSAPSEKVEPNV